MLRGIRVEGWMGLEDVDLAISKPMVLFMGLNGTGKTAVQKAIVWALTGRFRADQVGAVIPKKDLPGIVIRDEARSCRVGLMLGAALYVERALTAGGAETLKVVEFEEGGSKQALAGTVAELQAELYRRLQLDPGRAEAALDSWAFLALKDEDRLALLFRALGSASAEEIERRLGARGLVDPEAVRLARIAADKGFRVAEKAAVELRRARHRDLQDLPQPKEAPRTITVNGQERDLSTVNLAKLEDLLGDNRIERDRVLRSAGADLGAARARVETLEGQRAALVAREAPPEVDRDALRLRRTQAIERAKAAQAEAERLTERLSGLDAEIGAARAIAQGSAVEHPGTCPVVPGDFLCPASKSGLEVHARKLRKQAAAASESLAKLEAERAEVVSQREAAQRRADEAGAEDRRLAEEYRAVEEDELAAARVQGELEQIDRDLVAAREALAKAEASGEEQPTAFLDARIASIETVIHAKKAWDAAQADTTAQRREILVREHQQADALAQALAPEGIESELLRDALVPIRERLQKTGKMLGEITIGDDLSVLAVVDGRERRYEQLSRSQRLRLGIALQDAIASSSGLPLLLVDELDVFAGPDRAAVLGVLRALVSDPYGSVIGFATATEPAKAALPELAVYHVRPGGRIESVA